MVSSFDYDAHFDEMMLDFNKIFNKLVQQYKGLEISFKYHDATPYGYVQNECQISNVEPRRQTSNQNSNS